MKFPSKSQHQSSQTWKEQVSTSYGKKSRIAKKFSAMKKSSRGITIPDLKLYYKAIVINTTQYWYRDRLINGIESKNQK